jgi:hypothetical protein
MTARANRVHTDVSSTVTRETNTRLRGRWLLLARVGWIVVTVTIVVLNIIALPDLYAAPITPQELQELHRLGLSPMLYRILEDVEDAPFQVVNLALGLLLFLRRSNDRMALFCAFTLVTFGGALPFYDFSVGAVEPTLAANGVLRIVALVLFGIGESSAVIFFYLFPSGRFVPRWTHWCALLVVAYYLAVVFFPVLPSNAGGPATYFIPLSLVTAAVAQVYCYRRVSTPRERQQTKWAVFGVVLAIAIIAAYALLGPLIPPSMRDSVVLNNLNPVFPVALSLIPIFIAIAVSHTRLWDIDTLINRALVYGSLTALLAALYAGLIVSLEGVAGAVDRGTAQQPIVLVISTLVIAALFQPVRHRVQGIIDRRFYRTKYDMTRTLAEFEATLRSEVDPSQLSEHLMGTVEETMQPAQVSLWLAQPEPQKQGAASAREFAPGAH